MLVALFFAMASSTASFVCDTKFGGCICTPGIAFSSHTAAPLRLARGDRLPLALTVVGLPCAPDSSFALAPEFETSVMFDTKSEAVLYPPTESALCTPGMALSSHTTAPGPCSRGDGLLYAPTVVGWPCAPDSSENESGDLKLEAVCGSHVSAESEGNSIKFDAEDDQRK